MIMCESIHCCEGFKHITLQTSALWTQFPQMTSENTVSSTVISLCLITKAHKTQAKVCQAHFTLQSFRRAQRVEQCEFQPKPPVRHHLFWHLTDTVWRSFGWPALKLKTTVSEAVRCSRCQIPEVRHWN